jgi:hypothetical protein
MKPLTQYIVAILASIPFLFVFFDWLGLIFHYQFIPWEKWALTPSSGSSHVYMTSYIFMAVIVPLGLSLIGFYLLWLGVMCIINPKKYDPERFKETEKISETKKISETDTSSDTEKNVDTELDVYHITYEDDENKPGK